MICLIDVLPASKNFLGIGYARVFAESDSLGDREKQAFKQLAEEHGPLLAADIKAVASFLMWGSLSGNTLNHAKQIMLGREKEPISQNWGTPVSWVLPISAFRFWYVWLFMSLFAAAAFHAGVGVDAPLFTAVVWVLTRRFSRRCGWVLTRRFSRRCGC